MDNTGTLHRHVLPPYLILPDCELQYGSGEACRPREEYPVQAILLQSPPAFSDGQLMPTVLPTLRLKTLQRAYGNLASVLASLSCAPVPSGGLTLSSSRSYSQPVVGLDTIVKIWLRKLALISNHDIYAETVIFQLTS